MSILTATLQFLRGNKSKVQASTVVPAAGQPVAEVETGFTRLKIGDGVTQLRNLNYIGGEVYTSTAPTTIALGGITSGSTLTGQTVSAILETMLTPFQKSVLTALTHNLSMYEVGQTASGTIGLTLTITNTANLKSGSSAAVTSVAGLVGSTSIDPSATMPINVNLAGITRQTTGTADISVKIYDIKDNTSSKTAYVSWGGKIYYGPSTLNKKLTESEIKGLSSSNLVTTSLATYSYVVSSGSRYGYICIPKKLVSDGTKIVMNVPSVSQFYDPATNLNFAVDWMGDTNLTNSYGLGIVYSIFKTTNSFSGNFQIQIK